MIGLHDDVSETPVERVTKKLARVKISSDMLRKMMHLPQGVQFIDFKTAMTFSGNGIDLEILVEDDGLRDVQAGEPIPNADAWFRKRTIDGTGATSVMVTEFDKWYQH